MSAATYRRGLTVISRRVYIAAEYRAYYATSSFRPSRLPRHASHHTTCTPSRQLAFVCTPLFLLMTPRLALLTMPFGLITDRIAFGLFTDRIAHSCSRIASRHLRHDYDPLAPVGIYQCYRHWTGDQGISFQFGKVAPPYTTPITRTTSLWGDFLSRGLLALLWRKHSRPCASSRGYRLSKSKQPKLHLLFENAKQSRQPAKTRKITLRDHYQIGEMGRK